MQFLSVKLHSCYVRMNTTQLAKKELPNRLMKEENEGVLLSGPGLVMEVLDNFFLVVGVSKSGLVFPFTHFISVKRDRKTLMRSIS
jgi:hypothetical protein